MALTASHPTPQPCLPCSMCAPNCGQHTVTSSSAPQRTAQHQPVRSLTRCNLAICTLYQVPQATMPCCSPRATATCMAVATSAPWGRSTGHRHHSLTQQRACAKDVSPTPPTARTGCGVAPCGNAGSCVSDEVRLFLPGQGQAYSFEVPLARAVPVCPPQCLVVADSNAWPTCNRPPPADTIP